MNEEFYPHSLVNIYPNFDEATLFTSMWGEAAEGKIKESYPNLVAFQGKETVRKNVELALQAEPDMLFHWDHGGNDCLGGWQKDIILDVENANLMSGMHIYTFSCLSASKLGPKAINEGAYSYVGFRWPAMCYALAEPFQRKAAIYYPVQLTKELEELRLEIPDPEQEIAVVKKVFAQHKRENYKYSLQAIVTLMGAIVMFYNTLHLTLCLPNEEDLELLE
jgi:hypothetical protein